jgi:predicted phage terminase large subunit-like protein
MLCRDLKRAEANQLYMQVLQAGDTEAMRRLCKEDLFFLLTIALKRKDADDDWLYERCREVEAEPDGCLDLWSREHYKSTIITFALTVKDILNNPEETFGIFSHTRGISKDFLNQIKTEFEDNTFLQDLFPDVLYKEPRRYAKVWSLDKGITVKRKSNPREATVEAWGLVDGQPTGKHFGKLVFDDVVTLESVSTPEQIKKTTDSWALSLNLGKRGGAKRYIGTKYHYNDTYRTMVERGAAFPRIHPATHDGTVNGKAVFLTDEALVQKRKEMGSYVYACQMLQNPMEDSTMGFKEDWIRYYDHLRNHFGWNFYILVDPAGEKKKTNDYTVMSVIGLGPDRNYYLVDAIRDRLNLTERASKLFELHRKWRPVKVGYEKYGIQSDIEHVRYEQEQHNYRFEIMPLGGRMPKNDRIRKLVPVFETGRFWIPHRLLYRDNEGALRDFIKEFLGEEYNSFPVSTHDDMLDCMARILDPTLDAKFPELSDTIKESITYDKEVDKVQTDYDLFA